MTMKNRVLHIKRAKKLLDGFILSWSDPDPLSYCPNIQNGTVSHTRPLLKLQAKNVWLEFRDWIVHHANLLWRVDITVVFDYPNGRTQNESRRAVARGKLWEIAEVCHEVIEDAIRHGNKEHIRETRFHVQCLGDRSARDADFIGYEK